MVSSSRGPLSICPCEHEKCLLYLKFNLAFDGYCLRKRGVRLHPWLFGVSKLMGLLHFHHHCSKVLGISYCLRIIGLLGVARLSPLETSLLPLAADCCMLPNPSWLVESVAPSQEIIDYWTCFGHRPWKQMLGNTVTDHQGVKNFDMPDHI